MTNHLVNYALSNQMSKSTINRETKIKILMSAKKEFACYGFAGARMDSIARQTGVNKAMLHYYFGSKDQLYKEVIIYLVSMGARGDFGFNFLKEDFTPTQKLGLMIYFVVSIHFDGIDHDFHRIIAWDFAEGKNSLKMLVKDYFGPALVRLETIVIEGISKGEFHSRNPLMSVWSFIVFLLTYINQQEIYRDTEIYHRLYGENSKQIMLDFLFSHVFQSLGVMPSIGVKDIPAEILTDMDNSIKKLKNERDVE